MVGDLINDAANQTKYAIALRLSRLVESKRGKRCILMKGKSNI